MKKLLTTVFVAPDLLVDDLGKEIPQHPFAEHDCCMLVKNDVYCMERGSRLTSMVFSKVDSIGFLGLISIHLGIETAAFLEAAAQEAREYVH